LIGTAWRSSSAGHGCKGFVQPIEHALLQKGSGHWLAVLVCTLRGGEGDQPLGAGKFLEQLL